MLIEFYEVFERIKALICEVLRDLCLLQDPDKLAKASNGMTSAQTLMAFPQAYFCKSVMVNEVNFFVVVDLFFVFQSNTKSSFYLKNKNFKTQGHLNWQTGKFF